MERLRRWQTWAVIALFLLGAFCYFTQQDPYGQRGGRVQLDGFYYYVYLHSALADGDLDLANDYDLHGYGVKYEKTATGRRANPFSVGPAILWAPFLLLAHLLIWLARMFGVPGLSLNVMSEAHQNLTLFGTYLYGCGAIYICYRLLQRLVSRRMALLAALCAGIGSPLAYYMVFSPSYSHAQSALCFSALVWAWLTWREQMTHRRWAALGALAGLTTLMHPGNAVLCLLPAGTAVAPLVRALGRRDLRAALSAATGPLLAAAVAVAVFSPQMLAWKAIYGKLLVTPQGEGFMRLSESLWHATLFAPRNGLLPHAPLLAVGMFGLLLLLRHRPAIGLPAAATLCLLALVNGAVYDWWGWGFGARRYAVALPLFAMGVACAGRWLWTLAERHRERLAGALVAASLVLLTLFNLQLVREFQRGSLTGAELVPSRETYRIMFRGGTQDWFKRIGNPLSFPANWAFALRYGVDPDRYDLLYGFHFLDENHTGANPHDVKTRDTLDFSRTWPERFLLDGWGEITSLPVGKVRPAVTRRASFLLPLNVNRAVTLQLLLRPRVDGTKLRVLVNGRQAGQHTLAGRWQGVDTRVPFARLRRGMNRVTLEHTLPAGWQERRTGASRAIGQTGVTSPVDIAAVGSSGERGEFADIWVDGRRRCKNRRGLNVTAVEPRGGKVLASAGFDLHRDAFSARQLRRFIEALPPGTIVALASRDDASRKFNADAVAALRAVGVDATLAGKFRHALAAIGVRGAAPGSALQQVQAKQRAHAHVGQLPPPWRVTAWYRKCDFILEQ